MYACTVYKQGILMQFTLFFVVKITVLWAPTIHKSSDWWYVDQ